MSTEICARGGVAPESTSLPFIARLPPECGWQSPGRHWGRLGKDGLTHSLQAHGKSNAVWQPAKLISEAPRTFKESSRRKWIVSGEGRGGEFG